MKNFVTGNIIKDWNTWAIALIGTLAVPYVLISLFKIIEYIGA